MNRRVALGAIGTAGIASMAGCLGLAGLNEHVATPIGVDEETRAETGYEMTSVEEIGIEESVNFVLWSETVTVKNYVTEHEKSVSVGPITNQRAAVFMVISTPQVSVAGQEVNPIAEKSTADIVELAADNYDDLDVDTDSREDEELEILGQSTIESTFTAQATFSATGVDSVPLDVNVHVTEAVETDDDLVVPIGVYPRELAGTERPNIRDLLAAVSEDVDIDTDDGENDDDGDGGDNE